MNTKLKQFPSWIVLMGISICLELPIHSQVSRPNEGFTEPFGSVQVASPESGVIETLNVREGYNLKKGDAICRLDSKVLEATLLAARAKMNSQGKLNAAQATLENKAHHLQQMATLFEGSHASDQEVKQAELEVELAKANLQSAQDELKVHEMEAKRIEAQIERRIVRSPIDGVVLELPRDEGEAISTNESEVATIVRLDKLRVRYFLETRKAAPLKRGAKVRVRFPDTNQNADAVVDFVSPVTDSNSGTVRVELLIENANGQYRSGLRCVFGNRTTAVSAQKNNPN